MMNSLITSLRLLFVLCIPVLLIATNVRWVINDISLYEYEFNRYEISQETGLQKEQLLLVARQIQDYFNAKDNTLLDVRLTTQARELALFTPTEVLHMRDVKGLVRATYHIQEGVLLYILLFSLVGLLAKGGPFLSSLIPCARIGALITLSIVIITGILSAVAFSQIFYLFHLAGFRNVLWQLDPSIHYLVKIFPEGFFLDFTLFIGGATAVEALVLWGVTWIWGRLIRARGIQKTAIIPHLS